MLKVFFESCLNVSDSDIFREKILKFIKSLYEKHIFDKFYCSNKTGDFLDYFVIVEPLLYQGNSEYRDHFIHQFWVFSLGSYIINHNCTELRKKYIDSLNIKSGDTICEHALDYSWLLTSTLHDFAFPLDQINQWLPDFFDRFFPYENSDELFQIHMDRLLSEEKYLKKFNGLSTLFTALNKGESWSSKNHYKTRSNFHLTQILYSRLTHYKYTHPKYALLKPEFKYLKAHSVLSAISLLTKFSNPTEVSPAQAPYVDQIIYPSGLAIALHHLHPDGPDKHLNKLGKIDFSKHMLLYLLIFTDSVQEWYRLGLDNETEASLDSFGFEKNQFTVKIKWSAKSVDKKIAKNIEKLMKHIDFLKKLPNGLLNNNMKRLLKLRLSIQVYWGDTIDIDF